MKDNKLSVYSIAVLGLMIAVEIVLERFLSFSTPITRVGFAFVARCLTGMLFGPWISAFAGFAADAIGGYMIYGSLNPGISVVAVLRGFIWGLCLNKRTKFNARLSVAILLDQLFCSLVLTTGALYFFSGTGKTFFAIMASRSVQVCVMLPIEFVVLFALKKVLFPRLVPVEEKICRREVTKQGD